MMVLHHNKELENYKKKTDIYKLGIDSCKEIYKRISS